MGKSCKYKHEWAGNDSDNGLQETNEAVIM